MHGISRSTYTTRYQGKDFKMIRKDFKMNRKWMERWGATVAVVATVALVSACSSGGSEATGPQVLTVAIGQDLGTLDIREQGSAGSFSVLRHITEPLVAFSPTGVIEPALAESWEQTDPTTVRFNLRQNVTFSNGTPFNADLVKANIDAVIAPDATAWSAYYLMGLIAAVNVIDENTVDITLTSPTTRLLNELTTVDMIDTSYADQATAPVGTGPFLFESFTARESVSLVANPDYWGDVPKIDELVFRIIPDQSTRIAALEKGEVQMIDTVPFQSVEAVNSAPDTQVLSAETARLVFLAMDVNKAPLNNPTIRQAINYAIDKKTITETILQGSAAVPGGPCAPLIEDCLTDQSYDFDPEKAKSLMAEAGYDGTPLQLTIGTGRYPNDDLVGQALAKQLQDVGLKVELNVIDYASMRSQISEADGKTPFDMWMVGWSADDNVLTSMLLSLFAKDTAAYPMGYDNAEATKLLKSAAATADPAVKSADVKAAQKIIWDDAAVGFLYIPKQNIGVSKSLKGFEPRFDEYFFFWDASLS
jgi:ABC-type transport system substrate-binding protein